MDRPPARPLPGLLAGGALLLLGLVSASRMYFGYAAAGRPISALDALGSGLLEWGLWAPLLPFVGQLSRRFPLAPGRCAGALGVHLGASLAASLLEIVLFGAASAVIRELRFGSGSFSGELAAGFLFKLHTGLVAYWAALMGFLAWEYAARSRTEALRHAELGRSLAEARLAALQAQLAPHFLFNALNSVAASVREDPELAERTLSKLAALLRTVLARRAEPTQSLREELAFLATYLELQQERFGSRLQVVTRVDPRTLSERVPSFLLLPLVENALQHGVGRRTGPVCLGIHAERVGGRVQLAIEDDGPGFRADARALEHRGIGLESARERLRILHGEHSSFELGRASDGGAAIRLAFPALGPA